MSLISVYSYGLLGDFLCLTGEELVGVFDDVGAPTARESVLLCALLTHDILLDGNLLAGIAAFTALSDDDCSTEQDRDVAADELRLLRVTSFLGVECATKHCPPLADWFTAVACVSVSEKLRTSA